MGGEYGDGGTKEKVANKRWWRIASVVASLAHFTTHLLSLSRLHVGSTLADRATKMKIVNGLAGSTDFSLACCWTVSAANGSARCLGASNRKKVVIGDATKNTHTRALSLTEHTPKQKSNNSHREHS